MIKKSKISIPEWLQKIAKKYNIPETIILHGRTTQDKTVLELCGAVEGERSGLKNPQFNYKIITEFPYTVHGKEGDFVGIDFSGGPFVFKNDKITDNLTVVDIESHLITFEIKK